MGLLAPSTRMRARMRPAFLVVMTFSVAAGRRTSQSCSRISWLPMRSEFGKPSIILCSFEYSRSRGMSSPLALMMPPWTSAIPITL